MATDKPGVMTFLNPEVHSRLVAFKEKQRLRSLSHAAELALGEYFGVATTPIILYQSSYLEQPLQFPATLAAKVEQLMTDHESLHRALTDLQHLTDHLVALHSPVLDACCEHALMAISSPSQSNLPHVNTVNTQSPIQNDPINSSTYLANASEYAISTALARKGLTGLQLAGRLKVHSSLISRKKQKSYFKEWTSQLDPIGIGWNYSSVTYRFHPAGS